MKPKMKPKDKAALLAAFDLSPGSAFDRPGVLRSLCEGNAEAVGVLAAIEAGSPLPVIRQTIAGLPVDDAPAVTPGKSHRKRKRKKAK
jgi:hypothetical protein